jgi:hypothetical protein
VPARSGEFQCSRFVVALCSHCHDSWTGECPGTLSVCRFWYRWSTCESPVVRVSHVCASTGTVLKNKLCHRLDRSVPYCLFGVTDGVV